MKSQKLHQIWLLKAREEARKLVSQQMNEGQTMLSSLERLADPDDVEQKLKLWTEYNCELLRSLFNDSTLADEYV